MKLVTLQRAVARAVMQPLTLAERLRRKAPGGGGMSAYAARFIKPNDRLSSFERLEIYNRQYWFRLLLSMIEDFPGPQAVLGARQFEAMSKAYLTACPSSSFTLRSLGSRLEAWLRQNPKWIAPIRTLTLDMVRLEWAEIEAFDGQAAPALRSEDLGAIANPSLTLKVQPYVRLLDMHYPVDDLLLAVKDGAGVNTDVASNAFQERRKRGRVRAVANLRPEQICLVVHRLDYSVYLCRVEPEEFSLLSALRNGTTIERAIELAFRMSAVPNADRASFVQESFQTWGALGWFRRPEETMRGN